jgi:hypothetical protein
MIITVLVIGLVLSLAPRLSSGGKGKRKTTADRSSPTVTRNPYQSVSVSPGENACNAARKQEGKRFRTAEAPLFPLTDCNSTNCSCKYIHHEDQRNKLSERRAPSAFRMELFAQIGKPDRREQPSRRTDDWKTA